MAGNPAPLAASAPPQATETPPASSPPHGPDDGRSTGWRKRHISQGRAILPVDLRMRPAIAAIFGALLRMIITPHAPRQAILQTMLTQILRAEIQEKPGRIYPRHPRRGPRGKGKGNTRAQYQRRKQRKAEKQTHPA